MWNSNEVLKNPNEGSNNWKAEMGTGVGISYLSKSRKGLLHNKSTPPDSVLSLSLKNDNGYLQKRKEKNIVRKLIKTRH